MKRIILLISSLLVLACGTKQQEWRTVVKPLSGEKWWGAVVNAGYRQPYTNFGAGDNFFLDDPEPPVRAKGLFDLATMSCKAATAPILVSSKGRYVWGNHPFAFEFKDGVLYLDSKFEKLEPVDYIK